MAEIIAIRRRRRSYYTRTFWRFKDVQNPFDLSENEFMYRFKLSRIAAEHLINRLRPLISLGSNGYSLEIYVSIRGFLKLNSIANIVLCEHFCENIIHCFY